MRGRRRRPTSTALPAGAGRRILEQDTPRGQILACGSEDNDELIVATLDLDMIEEVRRTWQFFRDRRPDAYGSLVED